MGERKCVTAMTQLEPKSGPLISPSHRPEITFQVGLEQDRNVSVHLPCSFAEAFVCSSRSASLLARKIAYRGPLSYPSVDRSWCGSGSVFLEEGTFPTLLAVGGRGSLSKHSLPVGNWRLAQKTTCALSTFPLPPLGLLLERSLRIWDKLGDLAMRATRRCEQRPPPVALSPHEHAPPHHGHGSRLGTYPSFRFPSPKASCVVIWRRESRQIAVSFCFSFSRALGWNLSTPPPTESAPLMVWNTSVDLSFVFFSAQLSSPDAIRASLAGPIPSSYGISTLFLGPRASGVVRRLDE